MFGRVRRQRENGKYTSVNVREHEASPTTQKIQERRQDNDDLSSGDVLMPLNRSTRDEASGKHGCFGAGTGGKKPFLSESLIRAMAYGMVNGILLPPVSVSFAAIIFKDPVFAPFLPRLVKLVMFSSAVHMASIGTLSSLKFAVGAVQDAGLIFLFGIASSVVAFAKEQDLDEGAMLSTACFVLSTCTILLGFALVLLGRLRLANVVQYLPMPVIGGYLAFIGYFCGQAGLAFASGLEIGSIVDLPLLADRETLILVAPAVVAGVAMYLCLRTLPSPLTLPFLMVAFLGVFFAVLKVTDTSLEEARASGWFSEESPSLPLVEAWRYFDVRTVHWMALVKVFPNWLAMTAVVAFSSCLDVAAIEMEMGRPLNFDAELQTVGWSNVISGMSGGFTGSYIFSQTIVNLRAGVDTRTASATSFVMILAAAACPISVTSLLPRAFFGSLLILISADLMVEWLWHSRHRMVPSEYMVCLATFGAIQALGVTLGMLVGLVLAALSFTITYAQVPTVMTARVKCSTVMRTYEERVILQAHSQQMVVLELQGYIFFGSAVKILSEVKDRIVWGSDDPPADDDDDGVTTVKSETEGHHNFLTQDCNQLERSPLTIPQQPRGGRLQPLSLSALSKTDGNRAARALPHTSSSGLSPMSNLWKNPGTPKSRKRASVGDIWSPVFNRSGRTGYISPSTRSLKNTANKFGKGYGSRDSTLAVSDGVEEDRLASAPPRYPTARNVETSITSGSAGDEMSRSWNDRGRKREGTGGGSERSRFMSSTTSHSDRSLDAELEREANFYGSLEEGSSTSISRGGSGENISSGTATPANREAMKKHHTCNSAMGGGAAWTGDGAAQAYMSLWGNAGAGDSPSTRRSFTSGSGSVVKGLRMSRLASVSSIQLPASERRTRRVILDFSSVVGIDATAARSCFLMLKIVLQTSGAAVVFAGARSKIVGLLRSHGVINDDDQVFESLDTALEYSEEMLLKERRRDLTLQNNGQYMRYGSGTGSRRPRFPAFSSQQTGRPHVITTSDENDADQLFRAESNGSTKNSSPSLKGEEIIGDDAPRAGIEQEEIGEEGERAVALPSAEAAEARVFLGGDEGYYARAGMLRMRASMDSRIVREAVEVGQMVGDVGSLQSILEDYLEVDRRQDPSSVRGILGKAHRFFREERVSAGTVLVEENAVSDMLYFIGSGSTEIQVQGEHGRRRILKVCAGGTFGELGFYLLTPQPFRVVAREDCHLHTLDREGMAKMQQENLQLCVLIQEAVMKSMCLATSFSIEAAHMGGVDNRRHPSCARDEVDALSVSC